MKCANCRADVLKEDPPHYATYDGEISWFCAIPLAGTQSFATWEAATHGTVKILKSRFPNLTAEEVLALATQIVREVLT